MGIIIWIEKPLGILINNKIAAESYDKFFEMMWKSAKTQKNAKTQFVPKIFCINFKKIRFQNKFSSIKIKLEKLLFIKSRFINNINKFI